MKNMLLAIFVLLLNVGIPVYAAGEDNRANRAVTFERDHPEKIVLRGMGIFFSALFFCAANGERASEQARLIGSGIFLLLGLWCTYSLIRECIKPTPDAPPDPALIAALRRRVSGQ
jgi:hypothetical protein